MLHLELVCSHSDGFIPFTNEGFRLFIGGPTFFTRRSSLNCALKDGAFRMKRFHYLFAAAALLWMGSSRPAAAQAQVFSDQATWSAAAGTVVTRDFEELTDLEFVETVSYDGVTFSSTDGDPQDIVAISPDVVSAASVQSRVLASNRNSNPLIATFSSPVRAVGLDVLAFPTGTSFSVTVETGGGLQQVDVALTDGGPSFIGFVAPSGITEVTIANPAGQEVFVCTDNFSYGGVPDSGEDPVLACLDSLKASVEAGIADGSIKNVGKSLLKKVASARAAVERGKARPAVNKLNAFKNAVKGAKKKIAPAKAAELQSLADECIAANAG